MVVSLIMLLSLVVGLYCQVYLDYDDYWVHAPMHFEFFLIA